MGLFNFFKSEQRNLDNAHLDTNIIDYDNAATSLSFLNPQKVGIESRMLSLSAVFCAVEKISNAIGQLPIHIKELKSNKIYFEHRLNDVLKNSDMTLFMLLKMLVSDALLYGNGIAYIHRDPDGMPTEIQYCPKGSYSINYVEGEKVSYTINKHSNKQIEDCDVIHVYKNSKNGQVGIGFIDYAKRTIDLANSTENSAKQFFDSGMKLDGILKSTSKLSERQRTDIRNAWNNVHKFGNNGLVILGCDMDYTTIGSNANDSQLLETRLFNIQEVARFFSISPVLLEDLSKSSYSTIEASLLDFLIHTLSPFIALINEEFTRKLLRPSERKYLHIELCKDEYAIADKQSTANYLKTLVSGGIMSINEARHILKLGPVENGNALFVPFTDISQNTIGNTNNTEDKNTEETKE